MAEVAGKVAVDETDKAVKVTVTDSSGEEHAYSFPARTRLHVAHGDKVEVGQQLNEGSLYPADAAGDPRPHRHRGLPGARGAETSTAPQGVDINDKHIELIVRQMLKKVEVESKGSTGAAARPARGPPAAEADQQAGQGGRRHGREGEGGDPRDHQGLAGDRVLPLRGLLPGDDQGAHRRRAGGQARPPRRPEGERDHRQADPGRDRAEALPHAGDRAGRAGRAARARRACSTRRSWLPSSASRATAPRWRASGPRSPRSSRSWRRRSRRPRTGRPPTSRSRARSVTAPRSRSAAG